MANDYNQGKIVILNVHNGGHWVLATGHSGSSFTVNDPGYNTGSYTYSQIVRAGIYTKGGAFTDSSVDINMPEDAPADSVFDFTPVENFLN